MEELNAPLNLYFMLSQRKPLKLPMKDVNITEKSINKAKYTFANKMYLVRALKVSGKECSDGSKILSYEE